MIPKPVLAVLAFILALAPTLRAAGPIDPEAFTARALARVALLDLRLVQDPQPEDYALAAVLLGRAFELDPRNETILRHRIEAAWSARDTTLAIEDTRRLLGLDPKDTVALLRVISANLGKMNTAEERLAAYDRLLGPAGRSIPASVRSRLALDAALLAREQGDAVGFTGRLKEALTLDSTHKEAAALAVTYFSERQSDAVGRFELLSNLLMADPLDPNVHAAMARELGAAGVVDQAKRFHDLAISLREIAGGAVSEQDRSESMVLSWRADGTQKFLDDLNAYLAQTRRYEIQRLEAEGQLDQIDPAMITLPPVFERARAIAASIVGDSVTAESAVFNLKMIGRQIAGPDDVAEPDPERQRAVLAHALDLAAIRLWLDIDTEAALADARAALEILPPDLQRLDAAEALPALIALRSGDARGALEALRSVSSRFLLAEAALVEIYEGLGATKEMTEALRSLAASNPMTLPSTWAYERLKRETGAEVDTRTPAAKALARQARSIPHWVDRIIRDPTSFQSVEIAADETQLQALEPSVIRLRIKNTSPIPLSLGPDRVIQSRFLLTPHIKVGSDSLLAQSHSEVVDAGRRLRLESQETLEFKIDTGLGESGLVLDAAATQATRVRWRAIQGPTMSADGLVAGPLCMQAESEMIARPILPEAQITVEDVVRRIGAASEGSLPVVLGAARGLLPSRVASVRLPAELVTAIAEACAGRYPSLSPRSRALMLSMMPSGRGMPPFRVLDEAARNDTDETCRAVFLVTRVVTPTDGAITAGLVSESEEIRLIAARVKQRLENNLGGYSTGGVAR